MDNTSITKDVAILILGMVAGFSPWLLDKVGVEMPKPVAALCLYLSVPIVIWALVKLGWFNKAPLIEGRTVSLSTALLLCIGVLIEMGLWIHQRPSFRFDGDAKFEQIVHHTFVNEIVELDGKEYTDCIFQNVTFKYNGTTAIRLSHNTFRNLPAFRTDNPAVFSTIAALKGSGYLGVDVPLVEGPKQKPSEVAAPTPK